MRDLIDIFWKRFSGLCSGVIYILPSGSRCERGIRPGGDCERARYSHSVHVCEIYWMVIWSEGQLRKSHHLTILNRGLTDLLANAHSQSHTGIILGSSLIQLAGGEERRDEGHACHSSPKWRCFLGDLSSSLNLAAPGSLFHRGPEELLPWFRFDSISLSIHLEKCTFQFKRLPWWCCFAPCRCNPGPPAATKQCVGFFASVRLEIYITTSHM